LKNSLIVIIIIVGVAIAGVATTFAFTWNPGVDNGQNNNNNNTNARVLVKAKPGLFFTDSLQDGNQTMRELSDRQDDSWDFAGSALARGSPADWYQIQGEGLFLGVTNTEINAEWSGIFAMSDDDYATLYHAVISIPDSSLATRQNFNVGMYIQTDVLYGVINYVGCVANSTPRGPVWVVESGLGNATQVTQRDRLWTDNSTNQSATRDCTIVTNGDNVFKTYLDGKLVYSNEELDLKMPRPFNSYLETQVINSNVMVYGKFTDYYSTLNEKIKVVKAPPGGVVRLIGESNEILQSVPVNEQGIAIMNVGEYHFPLSAKIVVLDDEKIVAYTPDPIQVFGGDVYAADSLSPFDRGLLDWE
jgi:hypothetical protein